VSTDAEFKSAVSILALLRAPVDRVQGREQILNTMNRYTLAETCKILWQQPQGLETEA